MKASGEAATHLPWICPSPAALAALARSPTATLWGEIRSDPGAVLLVLRQDTGAKALPSLSFFPALLYDAAILQEAIRLLNQGGPGFIDWNRPAFRPIHQASLILARLAEKLAESTGRSDADNAWIAGLLAPLGWMAMAVLEPDSAAACLADPRMRHDPVEAQMDHWGLDYAAIARRLCRRWRLPPWLSMIAGHLDLSLEAALGLGADPDLFRIVQLAVSLAKRQEIAPYLACGGTASALAESLGLPELELASLEQQIQGWKTATPHSYPLPPPPCPPPASGEGRVGVVGRGQGGGQGGAADLSLLPDLLALAVENRKLAHAPILQELERQVDQLHRAFLAQTTSEEDRLQALKLNGLVEFAAGAGHEINNPLAVISGQAQYLLNHEAEPAKQRALQAIISQTQRIHQTLNEMMQFARPSPAQKQAWNVLDLTEEVRISLLGLAAQRRVQVTGDPLAAPIYVQVDGRQVKTALTCLLRNAIEAAPADGWAGIRLESTGPNRLDFVIEDNGPGPPLSQREHLFDPFFSGRQAGRGRGLGLCIAWRLARQNGGEVRYEESSGGPTRFVLSLPRTESSNGSLTNGHADPVNPGPPLTALSQ